MPKSLITHRKVLHGTVFGAPIATVGIYFVWFIATGTSPSAIVWQLAAGVFCVYLALAAVAWINSRIAQRKPSEEYGADRSAFLRRLGDSDIFVIAAVQDDGIDPDGMTKEQLLAEVERAAKDLNERQGFEPFVYEADRKRRLPFFTSNDSAQTFVGEYSKRRNRVYPFQLLGVKGSVLAQLLPACDVLVMNDSSDDEVELSEDDVAAIGRMWG